MQDECMGSKRLNRSRLWPTGSIGWGTGRSVALDQSRSVKNTLSLPVAFPSQLRFPFSWLTSSRGLSPLESESKCKGLEAWLKLQNSGTLTCIGKDLQGIQKGDEDIEVTPIKVAYKGHHN
ncbi:hypothetical protein AAG906_031178 [Vitis piasezkii]